MSYPYLPVNPCCTDVAINNHCGSTNNSNQCGTNITLSSNVIYNGPELPCITAEPCDTLNVVLQKIDEIICNLLSQINTLNTQVNNISNQIININSNIININDTLDVCCNVTTTTTTTIQELCQVLKIDSIDKAAVYTALDCEGNIVGGPINDGSSVETPCIIPSSVILFNASIIATLPCLTTTTTTTV
jgi:hypothetical protein